MHQCLECGVELSKLPGPGRWPKRCDAHRTNLRPRLSPDERTERAKRAAERRWNTWRESPELREKAAGYARVASAKRWGNRATRNCGCGHVVPYYAGRYLNKCDDCVGLVCKADGCHASVPRDRKWCASCKAELRRLAPKDNFAAECSDPNCARPVRARGVCDMHYKRIMRAEGRMKASPWDERRRMHDQARRARKMAAFVEVVSVEVVAERDGYQCGICAGSVDMQLPHPDPLSRSLDHVIPLSRGGKHSYLNTQLAHLRCNVSKGAKVPASSAVA